MRIALLNFPFDNNYGGNLQRFALMYVLESLGHKPEHLFTKLYWNIPNKLSVIRIFFGAFIRFNFPNWLYENIKEKIKYDRQNKSILKFYNKYVRHTKEIFHPKQLIKYQDYDAYIVGSDQVWRRSMSGKFPYETMFFSWLSNDKKKRIAYGVSFGIEENELSQEEAKKIKILYNKFYATSVREDSGLKLLEENDWVNPKAIQVLDPTLLLDKSVYIDIINKGKTKKSPGNMFCYVLDMDNSKQETINIIASEKGLIPFYMGINEKRQASIEQWLRSFIDSNYIVTDSFHGCVFSIIFNKPFKLMANPRRGMSRFTSLFKVLGIDESNQKFDWKLIEENKNKYKTKSIEFLTNNL